MRARFDITLWLMKVWLAYVCIIIFSFQVLPIKEIGKLLFKAQTTEEIHEDDIADDAPLKLKKEGDPFISHPSWELQAYNQYFSKKVHIAMLKVARLQTGHIPDIPTPPPNYCA